MVSSVGKTCRQPPTFQSHVINLILCGKRKRNIVLKMARYRSVQTYPFINFTLVYINVVAFRYVRAGCLVKSIKIF